jgi:hypothetical protein
MRRITAAIVSALTLAFLLLPVMFFLAAGIWALGTYGYSLSRLWSAASDGQIDQFGIRLDALNLAGHMLLASTGYFALVFALSVLAVGILGRQRRYVLITAGVVLAMPAVLGLSLGLQSTLVALIADLVIPAGYLTLLWIAISTYVLADAILLGVLLADPRSERRRLQRAARRAVGLLDSGPIAPMRIALAPDYAVPARERLREETETAMPAESDVLESPGDSSPDAPSAERETEPPAGEDGAV